MTSLLSTIILPIAVGAVALVLLLGLINMMKGGSPNTSQKLMRLRVLFQFVAIVIAMLAVWAMAIDALSYTSPIGRGRIAKGDPGEGLWFIVRL